MKALRYEISYWDYVTDAYPIAAFHKEMDALHWAEDYVEKRLGEDLVELEIMDTLRNSIVATINNE